MTERYQSLIGYTLTFRSGEQWHVEITRVPELRKQWALWITRDNNCQPIAFFRTEVNAQAAAAILKHLATNAPKETTE